MENEEEGQHEEKYHGPIVEGYDYIKQDDGTWLITPQPLSQDPPGGCPPGCTCTLVSGSWHVTCG